jgi:hypothetical protein
MADIYRQRFAELNEQMEKILASKKSTYDSHTEKHKIEIDSNELLEWKVKAVNLLSKTCSAQSKHLEAFENNAGTMLYSSYLNTLLRLRAIFLAAREDYEGGYLRSTRSLVQAEVFESELEQGRALFNAGYTSSAAIVAGVVLETSLRELCTRANIAHSKLDKMNADLAKAGTYNVLRQKRITALADIRNSAAHGKTEEFVPKDVEEMINEVERFVAEYL